MRRWELEKAKTSSNAIATPERADSEAMELLQVQLGELVYVKVRKVMIRVSFATFDTIPRSHESTNTSRFYIPEVKGITVKDEAALSTWLSWLRKDKKQIASLKLSPALSSVEQSVMTRRQRDRMMAKLQAEATRLISTVTHHSSPIIKDS